ncbi:UNVERIFIED_CONTAM: hypothetical protein FKN15_043223, partial [Acipenser sinensis]
NTDYRPGIWRRTDVHLENPEYHTRWYFKYFLGKEGQAPPVQVFDKTMAVKQMHVLEAQDLLITRTDKGKDARLFVFRLSAIKKGLEDKQLVRSKYDSRENKLEKTKGCHLYCINTHHSSELRIVVAIRNKLLLITRKQNRPDSLTNIAMVTTPTESPVEEFQYIREICLCDAPVVMALVDGPTGENDNNICVAYRHQFDLINESTGESYRLHHVEASRVNFVAAIDVYEDGEAGLLLCYNYACSYKKVCPFNGATPMIQSSASDFHFSWNQVPNSIVCAFPYILAFTTDSIEIRLVVNGNLVHTAVVPELQLVASRSDIYFTSSAAVNSASNSSSKEPSSHSSPQTPTGYEMPTFPSPLGDGEMQSKHIYKIPLSNLVGRSIERPLKSPLVNKVIATPTSSAVASTVIPVTHSLSLSRMEIKEIASRTRKELLGKKHPALQLPMHRTTNIVVHSLTSTCGTANHYYRRNSSGLTDEPSNKSEATQKQKKHARKPVEGEAKPGAARSPSSDRIIPGSFDTDSDGQRHYSTSSEPDTAGIPEESPTLTSPFVLATSFEEDIVDLK